MKLVTQIWNDLGGYGFVRHALVALLVGLLCLAGYVGYDFYAAQREAKAHRAFAESVELFELALNKPSPVRWQEAEASFKLGYKQFSSSHLAPFFLGYQSEALLKLGQTDEAVAVLDAMLSSLGKSSPLYGIYAVKRALIKNDVNELKKLADDSSLPAQDLALYHLGEYYAANNNPALAQDAWDKLKQIGTNKNPPVPSPWAELVAHRA